MKKALSIVIAISMLLSVVACSKTPDPPKENMVASSAPIDYFTADKSSASSQINPESPSANVDSSSQAPSSSSSQVPSSSSSQASSSSSTQASSSSSSQTPSSSSSQAVSSSSTQAPSQSSSQASSSSEPEVSSSSTPEVDDSPKDSNSAEPPPDEVRSVWISYLEYGNMLRGQSASQFRSNMSDVFETISDYGLNTVVVHVRPFGDAIYDSDIFPTSYIFDGTEGNIGDVPFDALQIMVEEADRYDLRIEAWINPYRVRNDDSKPMASDNPAIEMMSDGSRDVIKFGETITYNPASEKSQDLIVAGVAEIVENYDIDAIHFDDYFYPTTDPAFDSADYNAYLNSGGNLSLANWRRDNVTDLIRKVYNEINSIDPSVDFGISPQGNNDNNYSMQYVDIQEIVDEGLIDYLCPQIYFGFDNDICPYAETTDLFNEIVRGTDVDLYVGLATFKFGNVDTWAGSGKNEWLNTTDIIARQVEYARTVSDYEGFILYRYDSTFAPSSYYGSNSQSNQAETEMDNLKDLLN